MRTDCIGLLRCSFIAFVWLFACCLCSQSSNWMESPCGIHSLKGDPRHQGLLNICQHFSKHLWWELIAQDWGGVCLIVCFLRLFSIIWWDTYCTGLRWCLFVSVWLLRFQPSDDHALLFIQDRGGVQHWQSGRWWAHSSSQVGSYFVLCHLIGVFTFSVNWLLFSSLSSVLL